MEEYEHLQLDIIKFYFLRLYFDAPYNNVALGEFFNDLDDSVGVDLSNMKTIRGIKFRYFKQMFENGQIKMVLTDFSFMPLIEYLPENMCAVPNSELPSTEKGLKAIRSATKNDTRKTKTDTKLTKNDPKGKESRSKVFSKGIFHKVLRRIMPF